MLPPTRGEGCGSGLPISPADPGLGRGIARLSQNAAEGLCYSVTAAVMSGSLTGPRDPKGVDDTRVRLKQSVRARQVGIRPVGTTYPAPPQPKAKQRKGTVRANKRAWMHFKLSCISGFRSRPTARQPLHTFALLAAGSSQSPFGLFHLSAALPVPFRPLVNSWLSSRVISERSTPDFRSLRIPACRVLAPGFSFTPP